MILPVSTLYHTLQQRVFATAAISKLTKCTITYMNVCYTNLHLNIVCCVLPNSVLDRIPTQYNTCTVLLTLQLNTAMHTDKTILNAGI